MEPYPARRPAERLYYEDAFLADFDAVVTDIRLVSRTGGEALWQIALDRSGFYPTSGGQPFDRGSLAATSRSGAVLEVPIVEVEEDDHGEVWHFTSKPLVAGTAVRGSIDFERRLDHMQQHSGQHLLSALLSKGLNAHTISFHLGNESSTIDLNTASIGQASLERIELLANRRIAEDRKFSVRYVSSEESKALLATGELRKLPEREGLIRLIEIEGLDLNACGGTHVRSAGQIGGLLVRSTEKVRGGLRVEFVCGRRAVVAARRDFHALSSAAAALSAGREAVPQTVERLLAETKQATKERQKLREELARFEAEDLLAKSPVRDGLRVVRGRFPAHDADYLKLLAAQIASHSGTLALLASAGQDTTAVVMARGVDDKFSCGELIKSALADLGLRGGGSPSMAQGQVPCAALESLFDRLEAAARAGGR